jgi:DNA polymerase elongation subunit (family B)
MQTKRKRLYFDIEVSANIVMSWNVGYKINLSYDSVIKERAIICICYKWEDEKEVHALHWDKKQCDKKLLQEFIKVANQADELVGHNGDKFDLPWIRTRCLYHRVDLFPKYVTIDTLKLSRRQFRFNSNRLDYIASYLGIGKKIKTDFNLWKDIVLNKCDKSMKKMIDYCKQDVKLLEEVHKQLRVHDTAKTHFGVAFGQDRGTCPECGSDELIVNNRRITASGTKYIQYKCKTCGMYHQKLDK